MEFLGKMVKKGFKGFGVFEGVVDSYDPSTGFFKILYEDGNIEEADFSEVSRLVSEVSSSHEMPLAKKVGRKPKRRRRNCLDPGKVSDNLVVDGSDFEQRKLGGIERGFGLDSVNEICVSPAVNLNDNGLDLNRGFNLDDEVGKLEIDLNLTVVNDEFDEVMENGKKERSFDLNLGLSDDNSNGADETLGNDVCVGLGEEMQTGGIFACQSMSNPVVDANHVNSDRVFEIVLVQSCPAVVRTPCEDGNSGRKKRRKVARNLTSPTETVLRRSARRAKAMSLNECNTSADGANDLSMSGVTEESDEKPSANELERSRDQCLLPPKTELPPSSTKLNLEELPVLDLFCVYSCLRSFSTLLYLSPFEVEDFIAALKSSVANLLIDFIHVSVLQTLRKHLEFLANEGCESASICLRNMNWDILDVVTWPVFMVEYLLIHGSELKPGFSLDQLHLFDGEYYCQPATVKLELLRCLCDDVIEVEAIRSELNKRMFMADASMEIDRTTGNDVYRKRRTSVDALGESILTADMLEEVADGNSDECCLCKMDGNLICCDGCPAAYHTKCVGIVNNHLPEGDWYCPECTVGSFNLGMKTQKLIRGAELLGIDPYGRSYFRCFDYLLVSDSSDGESSFNYYHKDDLGVVIQLLRSCNILYKSILSAITQQWAMPIDLQESKSDLQSKNLKLNGETIDGRKARSIIKCTMEVENPNMSSEESAEVLQSNQLTLNSPRPESSKIADQIVVTKSVSASKQWKKNRSTAGRCKTISKSKEEDVVERTGGDDYMNYYSFAQTAASVVEELLRKPTDKVNVDIPKTEEEIISIQLKFILRKSTKFCWPLIQDLDVHRHKEQCGWCYCCRFPVEGRECLFSFVNGSPIAEDLKAEIDGLLSKKNKKGHLIDVICCMLSMQQRLRGLLLGPWLNPQYVEVWRKNVIKASDVSSLKRSLLMVEFNLHPLALSADWWKHVDSVATMGSASHFVANLRTTSKGGTGKRKGIFRDSEIKSLIASGGLGLLWWRGGKVSRSLFNWKVVPRSLVLKAARNAGRIKIPGIQYPDGSENARRSKYVAWRAAVETSTSLEQLALLVRELDMSLRWDHIENTHPHSMLDKESIKSIRLFKKAIIRRKSVEGTLVKYLIDFGKRRSIPDVVVKQGIKVEEPSGEKKKYWLNESHVPLHLLKSFEERRITRKESKTNSGKARKGGRVIKKALKKKGFDYLFSRAERADSYECGHCNKHVPISEAVSCQHCNGFFHKRHVTKSSIAIASGSKYTCHGCRTGKHVKNDSVRGKRQWGKVQDAKNVKVGNRGRLAKLRGRDRKSSKGLADSGAVISGRNKKVQHHKKLSAQDYANMYSGMTLRRSARKAACTPVKSNSSAGGKKKKRKRNMSRNVAAKETPKSSCYQKKRTRVGCSFWVNGLLLSKKPNDERVMHFKRRKLIVPSEFSAEIDNPPKCSLCSEHGFVSAPTFLACEICGDWFHGDAFGLNEGNVKCLIGFICHACRERSPPVCPFHDSSRDKGEVGTQNAQGSPGEIRLQKETDCVLEIHSLEVSSCLPETEEIENLEGKFRTVDNSDAKVNQTDNVSRHNRIESQQSENKSNLSTDHVQGFCSYDASLRHLVVQTVQISDRNLDQVKDPLLDPVSRLENSSSTEEEVLANAVEIQSGGKANLSVNSASEAIMLNVVESQSRVLNADLSTARALEFHSNDVSQSDLEFLTEQGCVRNPEHVKSPILDSQLTVEQKYDVQGTVRNLKHVKSPILDFHLRVDHESPDCKQSLSNGIQSQIRNLVVGSAAPLQNFQCGDVFLSNSEVQTQKNPVEDLEQIKTSILDLEFRVENGLPDSREVVSNATGNEKGNLEDCMLEGTKEAK